jgi:hypothetical protein
MMALGRLLGIGLLAPRLGEYVDVQDRLYVGKGVRVSWI